MNPSEAVVKISKLLPEGVTAKFRQGNFPAVTITCPEIERNQLADRLRKQFDCVGYHPSVCKLVHDQIVVEVVGDWPMLVEWFQVFATFERIEKAKPGASCGMISLGQRGEFGTIAWLRGIGLEETVKDLKAVLPEVTGTDDWEVETRRDHLTLKVPKWAMMAEAVERIAPSIE